MYFGPLGIRKGTLDCNSAPLIVTGRIELDSKGQYTGEDVARQYSDVTNNGAENARKIHSIH